MKHGKKYSDSLKLIDHLKQYDPEEAVDLVVQTGKAKFDETVEISVRLGVDPRHADQQVRGAVVLPHGTGRTIRVLVIAKGDKAKEAGLIIPVVITVYTDRTFTFITKTPPAPVLIKKELNLQKASGRPNKEKVGQLTKEQCRKIATIKMPDLNAGSIEAAMSMVAGTARSMGVTVEE